MRTEKQKIASDRNFMLMQIAAMKGNMSSIFIKYRNSHVLRAFISYALHGLDDLENCIRRMETEDFKV